MGREDRGRLPLCSRDPRVHARPGSGQLNEAQRGRFAPTAGTEPIAWAKVVSLGVVSLRLLLPAVVAVRDNEGWSLMEPRGCNQWQPFANRTAAGAAETSHNRWRGLRMVRRGSAVRVRQRAFSFRLLSR